GPGVLQNENTPSDNGFMAKLGFGTKSRELLHATARQAHALAQLLNDSGVLRGFHQDAYVLHMRHGSIVTVGGYTSLDDPKLKEMQRRLSTLRLTPQGGGLTDTGYSALELFAQPMPMRVPKL